MMAPGHQSLIPASSIRLGRRVEAHNSFGRSLMVVVLGTLVDALLPALEALHDTERQGREHEFRVVALPAGAEDRDAIELVRDNIRGKLDQVIIIAALEQDIVQSEALCARCFEDGVKVGAILVGEFHSGGSGRTAASARRYAETIAVVRDPQTAAEIVRAISG